MKSDIVFIHHGGCPDGTTAAWVFDQFRSKMPALFDRKVEYVAAKHGDTPPEVKGKEVWIADFSYPRKTLIENVIKPSARTVILDHHKTAQADLVGVLDEVRQSGLQRQNDVVVFDMERSGAGIVYDFLAQKQGSSAGIRLPQTAGRSFWIVDYVEDRDLWRFALPDSALVSAYIASMPMTFESLTAINAMRKMDVVAAGRSIQRYIDNYGERVISQARFEDICGYHVPTINVPVPNNSEHIGRLAEEYPDAPFAAGYFRNREGKWLFSLRSRGKSFDVSAIAKKFGGGGHVGAAGFDTWVLPWEKVETLPTLPTESVPATLSSVKTKLGENSE